MSQKLVPYEKYKDTGVAWLGQIPEEWLAVTIRRIADAVLTGGTPANISPSEDFVDGMDWYTPGDFDTNLILTQSLKKLASESIADGDAKVIPAGAVLIVSIGATLGKCAMICRESSANQQVNAIVPSRKIESRFLTYSLLSNVEMMRFMSNSSTIGIMNQEKTKELWTTVPPISEQKAIAAYLDRQTSRIDALVKEQEELILLLKEKRQALISHAVTKGLDPNAEMKPSGVEWLGDIPEGWEVTRLKFIATSFCDGPFGSGLKSEHYSEAGIRVIRLQNIGSGLFSDGDSVFIPEDHASTLGDHSVETDDVLIAGLGDESHPVGRACLAPEGISPAIVKADCFRFRLRTTVVPKYMAELLTSTAVPFAKMNTTGTTRERVNLSTMADRFVVVPPVGNQIGIVDFLNRETSKIDALITEAESTITLMQEHRAALISAVVTGKVRVPA